MANSFENSLQDSSKNSSIAPERGSIAPERSLEEKIRLKRCAKCGKKKEYSCFGKSETSHDGHQSYCSECKNALGKRRREKNVSVRLKHHTATRVASQLGDLAPEGLTTRLEELLGYRIRHLSKALSKDLREREGKKLRTALEEGYHIDHIKPLSRFKVITDDNTVDWQEFRRCWAIENLIAIPGEENLAKGAKFDE